MVCPSNLGGKLTFAGADSTLVLKIIAVQADVELDAANSVALFVDGADTYVYFAGAASGNADNQMIKLAGVMTLSSITVAGNDITII